MAFHQVQPAWPENFVSAQCACELTPCELDWRQAWSLRSGGRTGSGEL